MTKFVLISGKKQSGKDFTAKTITEELIKQGYTVETVSFADPIKKFVTNVFGISREDMETEEGKQKLTHLLWDDISWTTRYDGGFTPDDGYKADDYLTVRHVLQIIGTDVCRNKFYDKIWAEAPFMKKYITPVRTGGYWSLCGEEWNEEWDEDKLTDFVIIPDCRFPNEVRAGEERGATLVRIVTPAWGDVAEDNHASETALDDWDWKFSEKLDNKTVGPERIQRYVRDILLSKLGHNEAKV